MVSLLVNFFLNRGTEVGDLDMTMFCEICILDMMKRRSVDLKDPIKNKKFMSGKLWDFCS